MPWMRQRKAALLSICCHYFYLPEMVQKARTKLTGEGKKERKYTITIERIG